MFGPVVDFPSVIFGFSLVGWRCYFEFVCIFVVCFGLYLVWFGLLWA